MTKSEASSPCKPLKRQKKHQDVSHAGLRETFTGVRIYKDPIGAGFWLEVVDVLGYKQEMAITADELRELKLLLNQFNLSDHGQLV